MKVWVEPPVVDGESVTFRWTQSAPNPFQRQNAFFFRYEGLNLTVFSPLLFYEVFLGLQLKVFAAYAEPVEVVFPEPLTRSSVEFWRAYHDAERVTIAPIHKTVAYEPWQATLMDRPGTRPYAVFFGGGKDSTLSAELLAELYGGDRVLLIQFIGPLNLTRELERRLTRRQEELMLRPARKRLGVASQRIWTDYQAQFRREGYRARPHVELYTAGALPALLAWGVSLVTFSYDWTEYFIYPSTKGRTRFRFGGSRPEMLATQGRHYARVLGPEITVTNLALLFSGLTTMRLLVERYPAALPDIVPCTICGVDERWCYNCRKCRNYALLGLACGYVDPHFDYDRLFAEARFVRLLVEYAESGVARDVEGNAPCIGALSSPQSYATYCQAIAHLSPSLVADRLGPKAMTNLRAVRSLFGNREFPAVDLLPARTLDLLGHETARRVARIAAEHIPAAADPPSRYRVGKTEMHYDFGVVMTPRTAHLDHLRPVADDDATSLDATEDAR